MTIKGRKGDTVVDTDEHPRGDTTLEMLAKLRTPFRDPGTVTAGNASGVNDGVGGDDPGVGGRRRSAMG